MPPSSHSGVGSLRCVCPGPAARHLGGMPPAGAWLKGSPTWHDCSGPTESARPRQRRHHRRAGPRPVRGRRARPWRRLTGQGPPPQGRRRAQPPGSGEFLSAAVLAGLASAGVDVYDAGVLPTPAVAYLTADTHADFGVMLSASTTPCPTTASSSSPKAAYACRRRRGRDRGADGTRSGRAPPARTWAASTRCATVHTRYIAHLLTVLPNRLDGLSTSSTRRTARPASSRPRSSGLAGATVYEIGADPDGLNIDYGCGSTHLDHLKGRCSRGGPTSASRTTATPTDAWRSTPRERRSTATRTWPSSPWP